MPAAKSPSSEGSGKSRTTQRKPRAGKPPAGSRADFTEELVNRGLKPLDVVLLTRERIQATLDEAAALGRLTRSDADELVSELVKRGRQQTNDLLAELEGRLGRPREQLDLATRRVESATKRVRRVQPIDRLVRGADRARRTAGASVSFSLAFPISGYDELTVAQVEAQLPGLTPPQLRKIRDYERSHANRKSVLAAVEKLLS